MKKYTYKPVKISKDGKVVFRQINLKKLTLWVVHYKQDEVNPPICRGSFQKCLTEFNNYNSRKG